MDLKTIITFVLYRVILWLEAPKLLSIKNYVMFVNQLTDDELTTRHYQQDGAKCPTSNASVREIENFFRDKIISKNL